MKNGFKNKAALLAASSLLAASVSFSAAATQPFPEALPTTIEAPIASVKTMTSDEAPKEASSIQKWAFAGIFAAAFAGIIRLIGARRAVKAVSKAAQVTVRGAASVAGGVAKAAGRLAGAPLRWAAALTGLGLFILLGVGLYDIEWIAGLVIGAAIALAGAVGLASLRRRWFFGVRDNKN